MNKELEALKQMGGYHLEMDVAVKDLQSNDTKYQTCEQNKED